MQSYTNSLTRYKRLDTVPVKVGHLIIGGNAPIRVQTMTTTDSMDTAGTVAQSIRCIQAGAELIRITAPSKLEAENLRPIKEAIRKQGYDTPLVADIHFTPNAAEIAARIVEKVRVNPGNYADKKKFAFIDYTDQAYTEEIERIGERFIPLVTICKEYGTAMRIGTNHGSLSDRIMSRYGDSPMGMVESAMEFLRIARSENYHNIVLSMKSSNPLVMIEAYRMLIRNMGEEFNLFYPLHIGVTEDPEFEIPVCQDMVQRYHNRTAGELLPIEKIPYSPFVYKRRPTTETGFTGDHHPPVVISDFMKEAVTPDALRSVGYIYSPETDKWNIGDAAADFLYTGMQFPGFALPGTLRGIVDYAAWRTGGHKTTLAGEEKFFPLLKMSDLEPGRQYSPTLNFLAIDTAATDSTDALDKSRGISNLICCLYSSASLPVMDMRRFIIEMMNVKDDRPVIICVEAHDDSIDRQLIHFAVESGALLADGMGDGIWLMNEARDIVNQRVTGRTYLAAPDNRAFLNNTAFSILQAARTRISKTEYISCPSCGRTLFDLQETTARIRSRTSHLKGLKIAIMGCIVNGPGEMADADFGYVGSGPGKITLYKGKDVVKRSVDSDVAVDELINLLKENNEWIEPGAAAGS